MDLERLALDWAEDPALEHMDCEDVRELAGHLLKTHQYLKDPQRGGPFAYLYLKQIQLNRELKQELEHVRRNQS